MDPPVAVDAIALPKVLAETFENIPTPTLFRYRRGDHGICWIDFGAPPRHSFALPLDFAIRNDIFGGDSSEGEKNGIALKDNFIALGGQDGRVIAMDFSNLVDEVDLSGSFWHCK